MQKIQEGMLTTIHSSKLFPGLWRQVVATLLKFGEQETHRLCHILVFVQFCCDTVKIKCPFANALAHLFLSLYLPNGQKTIDSHTSLAQAVIGALAPSSMIVQIAS